MASAQARNPRERNSISDCLDPPLTDADHGRDRACLVRNPSRDRRAEPSSEYCDHSSGPRPRPGVERRLHPLFPAPPRHGRAERSGALDIALGPDRRHHVCVAESPPALGGVPRACRILLSSAAAVNFIRPHNVCHRPHAVPPRANGSRLAPRAHVVLLGIPPRVPRPQLVEPPRTVDRPAVLPWPSCRNREHFMRRSPRGGACRAARIRRGEDGGRDRQLPFIHERLHDRCIRLGPSPHGDDRHVRRRRGTSAAYNNLWMGLATGWWLEGYANRKAIYEANLPLLPFSARWDNVRDANRLFAGDTVFEDGVLRVADSFPFDDAAAPKVYTGYFLDFHDFVGFAVPRLVNSTTGQAFTLVLGADPRYDRGLANGRGWVSGNYSGPGFTATRIAVYDYASTTVSLSLTFAFVPASPWDAFEMTIRVPPWTQLNLARLDQQTIDAQIPDVAGSGMEAGSIAFVSSNLSSATEVPQIGSPGEMGVGLRWKILNSAATFEGRIFLTKFPTSGPPRHAPFMKSADQILSERAIDFLFISMDSISDIQRFDRQASRFERAFANAGVVIFRVI